MAATTSYHALYCLLRTFNQSAADLPITPWSKCDKSATASWSAFKNAAIQMINFVSGNDITYFLTEVIPPDISRNMPHGQALQALAPCYNELTGTIRRPLLVALKQSDSVKLVELRYCGFKIKEENYQRCDKDVHNDDVGGNRPAHLAGLKPKIDKLCHEASSPVNTGIVRSRKRALSAAVAPRRLESSYRELYSRFEDRDNISYSTFRRYCDAKYTPYSRATDCCDYCLEGRRCEKQIAQFRRRYNEIDTSANLVLKYGDRPQHPLFQLASCIMEVSEHREHKRVQRVVYNRHTNALRPKEVTIECDWRKKGHLPITDDEAGSAWYNHTQYALFGVAVYWCDEDGITQHHSIDVLSQSITEDSHCSLEGLRTALRQVMHNPLVPCDLLGATKIHFWSDTGPHFRSHEYLHFCLKEFPQTLKNGARFDVNYLAEKHGKNQRDSHFRCVRSYTMRAARGHSKAITTCSELKECLVRAHAAVQVFNNTMGHPEESCDFYLLNLPVAGTYEKKRDESVRLMQYLRLTHEW